MSKIYKTPITHMPGDHQHILPGHQTTLSIGVDPNDQLCIWWMFDSEVTDRPLVVVYLRWTGDDISTSARFLGTVQYNGLMYHAWVSR